MKIKVLPLGFLQANCYILEIDNEIIIIDPADDYEKIRQYIGDKKLLKILVTHYHADHIGALKYFDDSLIFKNFEEKEYKIGKFSFGVIFTKGHTSDSVTYYFQNEKCMFTGDFLFKNSIGRTDLYTGNDLEMKKSLNKIIKYSDDIVIYPGHGGATSLKYEKENNIFLRRL